MLYELFERSDIKLVRPSYLFHGTGLLSLAKIIYDDRLERGVFWNRPGEPDGVRTTRSYRTATLFAENDELLDGGVIVLNQKKLRHRYRVVPYQDVDDVGTPWPDEYEEVILAPNIYPLSEYMRFFVCSSERIMAVSREDISYWVLNQHIRNLREGQDLLENLLHHPARRDAFIPILGENTSSGRDINK